MPLIAHLEDSEPFAEVLRLVLAEQEIMVAWYPNKADFLRHPEHPIPELIITDIHSPEMGGIEFLYWKSLIERLANVPVVVCSGCPDDETRREAMNFGAAVWIEKPCEFRRLAAEAMRLLGEREQMKKE